MQITVRTKSGSVYCFTEKDGEIYMTRNFLEEGILAKPVSIVPGEKLEVHFYQLNPYDYSRSNEVSTYRSTPVKKIEIAWPKGASLEVPVFLILHIVKLVKIVYNR